MSAPPDTEVATDCDVVIVGAGPVGLVLAIQLAQLGHQIVVLERWAAPYPLPRAVHFDDEVGRILAGCGIGTELRAISQPAEIYEWCNAAGTTLLRFGRIGAGPSGWPRSSMFCQPELERLLERRAGELGLIEIRRGAAVTSLEQRDGVVEVKVESDGGQVRARYAVGCDGANSTVRTLIDITPHDLGFFYDWLIVDVILDAPREFDPLNVQICDPVRPTTAVSGGPGRRRWEFMRLPHESLEELNDESRAWELLAPWDVHPSNAHLERHAVYTFQARYADQWRSGRVLLAGDAAHQMPPFAGQGLCSGVRDAANLAWKLDLVLGHRAPERLLDSYTEERLPSVRQAIEFSMELGKVICVADPDEAAARDAAMSGAVTDELADAPALPGLTTGVINGQSPHAGSLFVQGTIAGRLFDDIHGTGWRLVTIDPTVDIHAVDPAVHRWFASIGGTIVGCADADAEADPTYRRWFADHDATCALMRPDFSLYGTATTPADAAALMADLRRQLTLDQPLEGASV